MTQQRASTSFPDARDLLQAGVQRFLPAQFPVELVGEAVGFVADALQVQGFAGGFRQIYGIAPTGQVDAFRGVGALSSTVLRQADQQDIHAVLIQSFGGRRDLSFATVHHDHIG